MAKIPNLIQFPRIEDTDDLPTLRGKLQTILSELQIVNSQIALRINTELAGTGKNAVDTTAKFTNTVDVSGGFLIVPVIAGDPATPTTGEVWLSTATGFNRLRVKPATIQAYSMPFYNFFTSDATISNGATSVAISLSSAEPDAAYGVSFVPAWTTAWSVTVKTATNFTVTFGTAPSATSTATYWITR